MKILPDTSVIVASLQKSHIHHERAYPWLERIVHGEMIGVLAAHALAETYSVFTRMPLPDRLSPHLAWAVIMRNLPSFEIVALTEVEIVAVLTDLASQNIGGGLVYDALIAAVARKANVDLLLTFNTTHFRRVAPDLTDRIQEP